MSKFTWFLLGTCVGAAAVVLIQQQGTLALDPDEAEEELAKKGEKVEALAALFSAN